MMTENDMKTLVELFTDTPSEQLQALFASGLLADLRDADISKVDREKFRRMLDLGPLNPRPLNTKFLKVLGTVTLPESAEFVARQTFLCDTRDTARVKIKDVSEKFQQRFFGTTEAPRREKTLRYAQLAGDSRTKRTFGRTAVAIHCGIRDDTFVTLTDVFALMENQRNGESGPLLTNGKFNNFLVMDSRDECESGSAVVVVFWGFSGWCVFMDDDQQSRLSHGSRVFWTVREPESLPVPARSADKDTSPSTVNSPAHQTADDAPHHRTHHHPFPRRDADDDDEPRHRTHHSQ